MAPCKSIFFAVVAMAQQDPSDDMKKTKVHYEDVIEMEDGSTRLQGELDRADREDAKIHPHKPECNWKQHDADVKAGLASNEAEPFDLPEETSSKITGIEGNSNMKGLDAIMTESAPTEHSRPANPNFMQRDHRVNGDASSDANTFLLIVLLASLLSVLAINSLVSTEQKRSSCELPGAY